MKLSRLLLCFTLIFGIGIGFVAGRIAGAQRRDNQDLLMTVDLNSIPGKEARMWIREIAPGERTPAHYHPGDVVSYVLEGSVVHNVQGQAPVTFSAGQSFHETSKEIHFGLNPSSTTRTRLLAIQIADKGEPVTIPVK